MDRKTIILSGVNLFQGGTLKIMQDCIDALDGYANGQYRIIALVHNEKLYKPYESVEYLSFPLSRKSWLFRIYHEYVLFNRISKKYKPDLWFSLHDCTPRVKAKSRVVYCHHAAPFYTGKRGWRELRMEPSFVIFSLMYKWFYKINLKKNDYIVVQQEWMRQEFIRMADRRKVIVATPEFPSGEEETSEHTLDKTDREGFIFFYPSVPRVFKNFEVIGEAAGILQKRIPGKFKIFLTLDGSENKYAKWIREKYSDIEEISFIGLIDRKTVEEYYRKCDCVIFPSQLESWGLPLSEAKKHRKPIIAAELPYALETIGCYNQAAFFNPKDALELAALMDDFIFKKIEYKQLEKKEYESLFAPNWPRLFDILLKEI